MNKQRATASVVTKRDANRFSKAAKIYAKKVTKTQLSAREALVEMGIYTKKGNLRKNYK